MQDLDKFKNEMNLSGKNVYVGHRYVPKIFGEWDNSKLYEPLSIVLYQGASYTSRQYVPVGIEITNEDYWALTGNYNAQIEQYRQEVGTFKDQIDNVSNEVIEARTPENHESFESINQRLNWTEKRLTHVTYDMFGAKLDGVTDDTLAIKAAHDYANENNLNVQQHYGSVLITDTVTVKTSTDLSGTTLVMNQPSQNGKTLYSVESKNEEVTVPLYNQSEFSKGSSLFPSLSTYKNSYITIDSNELALERQDGGNTYPVYKKDSLVLNSSGGLSSVPLIENLTNGVLNIKARKIDTEPLIFKGLNIEWNFNDTTLTAQAIRIKRSNTKLKDIKFNVLNNTDKQGAKGSVFSIQYCTDITIDNIQAEGISDGRAGSTYMFYVERVANLNVNNSTLLYGWHSFGSNGVKDWTVKDSTVNGLDVHYGMGDVYCDNVTFLGKWGFNLGYGDGTIKFKNCTTRRANSDFDKQTNSIFYFGKGYVLQYEGDIYVENHTVEGATYNFAVIKDDLTDFDGKPSKDIQMPNLYVNGLKFKNNLLTRFVGYLVGDLRPISDSLVNNNKVLNLPDVISIKNVYFDNKGEGLHFYTTNFSLINDVPSIKANLKIELENIDLGDHKAQLSSYTMTPDRNDFNVDVDVVNCVGFLHYKGGLNSLRVKNSSVSYDTMYSENAAELSCKDLSLNDSSVYYGGYSTSTRIKLTNGRMVNCIIHSNMVDGVYQPITEVTHIDNPVNLLLNNVFIDKTVTDAIAAKYFKYINPDTFKDVV